MHFWKVSWSYGNKSHIPQRWGACVESDLCFTWCICNVKGEVLDPQTSSLSNFRKIVLPNTQYQGCYMQIYYAHQHILSCHLGHMNCSFLGFHVLFNLIFFSKVENNDKLASFNLTNEFGKHTWTLTHNQLTTISTNNCYHIPPYPITACLQSSICPPPDTGSYSHNLISHY